MNIQLPFLRYYQVPEAKKQTHYYWKFWGDEISAQEKMWKTIYSEFEQYDIASTEVSHYGVF